jgi:flagellar protein FliS
MDNPKKSATTAQFESYRKADIMTANRETILLMMYEGAIRFLKQAIDAAEHQNLVDQRRLIGKSQGVVNELRATLNFEKGQEIASNLESLYDFITNRLIRGSLENSVQPLNEALKVLETLHFAWQEAIQSLRKERTQADK